MSSPYHRPWPLLPNMKKAIEEQAYAEAQKELNRWYLTWVFVLVPLILVASVMAVR